jgi:hypothetical protein
MTVSRAFKKLICFVLSGSLLFSQLAVAGYACPNALGMKAVAHSSSAMTTDEAPDPMSRPGAMSPDCDQIDRDAVNLCVEQCNFGSQSTDRAQAPVVPAPILAVLYFLPVKPEPASGSAGALPPRDAVIAASCPPHAILHCVFLI